VKVYFDTSAFIPMLADEPSKEAAAELWRRADRTITTRLLFVESRSAISRRGLDHVDDLFSSMWRQFDIVELEQNLMEMAGAAAEEFGLRGFDAVHCAAGASLGTDSIVLASADRRLLTAWESLGCTTFDPNRN
jgi:predicted nucleic acid-binding protein